ncbi:amidohydrolase [Corynebacterium camporealensis]
MDYSKIKDKQEELYIDLHKHPELSMQEERTRGLIADHLKDLGYEVTEVGGGVVGTLENGDGKTVMLRADFDGLPVKEDTGLDYASTQTMKDSDGNEVPVMHACGHDAHTASLLGMGELMVDNQDDWSGTLQLLFQPGEETAEGAQAMVDDGLVDKVAKPDVVLGQHVFALEELAGGVGVRKGPFFSTATSVDVKLYGEGSHGSMPHKSIDPVVLASSIVMRLQTVVARELSPSEFGVLTVGSIQAGSKANVIPFEATLKVNIRAYSEEIRDKIAASLERIVKAECAASESPREPEFTYHDEYPLTDNDEDVTEEVLGALTEHFGEDRVIGDAPKMTASEDFSIIPDAFEVPYCYWVFGGAPVGEEAPNHSPHFAPTLQPTLQTGTEALLSAALHYLGK